MELTNNDILEVNLLNGIETITINSDEQIEQIVKALSSQTRRNILRLIQSEPELGLDVSNIASKLGMTEANISAQIKKLEKAGLIKCDYSSGQHGIRKISTLKYDKLTIAF